jgi:hypothetical protein
LRGSVQVRLIRDGRIASKICDVRGAGRSRTPTTVVPTPGLRPIRVGILPVDGA